MSVASSLETNGSDSFIETNSCSNWFDSSIGSTVSNGWNDLNDTTNSDNSINTNGFDSGVNGCSTSSSSTYGDAVEDQNERKCNSIVNEKKEWSPYGLYDYSKKRLLRYYGYLPSSNLQLEMEQKLNKQDSLALEIYRYKIAKLLVKHDQKGFNYDREYEINQLRKKCEEIVYKNLRDRKSVV